MQIFEMMGGTYSKPFVEKLYLANNKEFEIVLNLFLEGNVPNEES